MISKIYQEYSSIDSILLDPDKFRELLQIDANLFQALFKVEELSRLVDTVKNSNQEEEFRLGEMFSSMGSFGQFSFGLMVVSSVTGWTPSTLKKIKTENFRPSTLFSDGSDIPKNQCPVQHQPLLGIVIWTLLELLVFPCLKVAYADGDFSIDERDSILDVFVNRWGLQKEFVESILQNAEPKLEKFEYEFLGKNIQLICKQFPEIDYRDLSSDLLRIIRQIILADGIIHPSENRELDKLINSLELKEKKDEDEEPLVNNFWDYIFHGYKKKREVTILDILQEVPLFNSLTKRELRTIAKIIHRRMYQKGEVLFQKGDPGAAMYIIKQGSIKIVINDHDHEKEITLATLHPGTFVGELALLDNSPRSATAKAIEPTEALAFFRSELNKLLKTHPAIGSKIMKELAIIVGQRLKATNEQLYAK